MSTTSCIVRGSGAFLSAAIVLLIGVARGQEGKPIAKPEAAPALPSLQKVKEAEEAYWKAREAALKEIDDALTKTEADVAKAVKDMSAKDPAARANAAAAVRKAHEDLHQLHSSRMKVLSPRLSMSLPYPARDESRLGVRVDRPHEIVAAHLKLEKGQGMVIGFLDKNGAAAKAGLKVHDVLVELDGKPVSSDIREFRKQIAEIKADASVSLVIVREGKRETIKGMTVPALQPTRTASQ